MDPALLKRSAPGWGMQSPQSYYSRLRDGRYVPYGAIGHSQVHSTYYARERNGRHIPYGSLGHSQVHSTYYDRQRDGRWTPYGGLGGLGGLGDFVYKPVTNAEEVLPGVECEAYGGLGAFGQEDGWTTGNVFVAGVIGFMLGQFFGEHFERGIMARRGSQG